MLNNVMAVHHLSSKEIFFLIIITDKVAINNIGTIVHDGNSGIMSISNWVYVTNNSSVSSSQSLYTSKFMTILFATVQLFAISARVSSIIAKAEGISISVYPSSLYPPFVIIWLTVLLKYEFALSLFENL